MVYVTTFIYGQTNGRNHPSDYSNPPPTLCGKGNSERSKVPTRILNYGGFPKFCFQLPGHHRLATLVFSVLNQTVLPAGKSTRPCNASSCLTLSTPFENCVPFSLLRSTIIDRPDFRRCVNKLIRMQLYYCVINCEHCD